MSASLNDLITDTRNSARPNSARASSSRSPGDNVLPCDNLAGWPTASKVHFVTYKLDASNKPVPGSQLDCYGIRSGNDLTDVVVVDGVDTGNQVNDVVAMLPTSAWGQDLADALTLEHDRFGAHNDVLFGRIYPIGSIYINATNSANPATLFGFGTWVAFGAGRVPVGFNNSDSDFNSGEKTGGEKTHTLVEAEMPNHRHWISGAAWDDGNFSGHNNNTQEWGLYADAGVYSADDPLHAFGRLSGYSGGGGAHNVMQPFITVYMWKRTA